ncbi:hypothetical protein SAMN05421740_107264 [Parapedobacter koreensis]|uniref:Uncharacterized protein n=1 Tax=Parapedobacter koreensis TaxID=332977 RepID=A0A1H7RRA7_9SPHI|nr:hypothetical protein SAMN05421740_107264 [Parapedobacter koreensis]
MNEKNTNNRKIFIRKLNINRYFKAKNQITHRNKQQNTCTSFYFIGNY